MSDRPTKRFVFLGGIPVFDHMIRLPLAQIARVAGSSPLVVGGKLLIPLGTVFRFQVEGLAEPVYVNPMANAPVQQLDEQVYYELEFGGKHGEQFPFTLSAEPEVMAEELQSAFPDRVSGPADLHVVEVEEPVSVVLGGNNKNIIEEIKTLYASPELADLARGIAFEHHFFCDVDNPMFERIRALYDRLQVAIGEPEQFHVAGLVPRIGYVFTFVDDDGAPLDRIILSNRTNEEIIPAELLSEKYFGLQYRMRRDDNWVETHLVINSMTNPEEIRLLVRLLQTAYASGVCSYLCPTGTLMKGMDRLIESKYYAMERERFYSYRKDFLYTAVLPYVRCLILNKSELEQLDNVVMKRGIDATASHLCHQMNRGKRNETLVGGRVVVTGGSKGARYTERLLPERAQQFWRKADLPAHKQVRYADRRIVCGDDYVTGLTSTLGAGDLFTGIFIGLSALQWDGGHALRAATLGAQHFIQKRTQPRIQDMVEVDESHIRMGTETELVDVISHHVDESGDPTRYGTISDTVITVNTTQIQHPFREVLELTRNFTRESCGFG